MSSADRIRRRAERGWADTRRVARRAGSARPARRLFRGARRRDRAGWNRATSDAHEAMRASVRPADGSVAIVCVSMRPSLLGAVVGHVASQRDGGLTADPDVVFVANDAGFEDVAVRAAFDAVPNSTVIWPDEPLELGSALNLAMASTDARYVAKFDDDDRYGPA
ncbi:MAG: glycosyltransferase family A protein, partial [Actinomycetota bacterium]